MLLSLPFVRNFKQWHSHLPVYLNLIPRVLSFPFSPQAVRRETLGTRLSLPLNFYISVSGCGCGFEFEQKHWWFVEFGEKRHGSADLHTPFLSPFVVETLLTRRAFKLYILKEERKKCSKILAVILKDTKNSL